MCHVQGVGWVGVGCGFEWVFWAGVKVGADVSELGFGVWHGGLCELHGVAAGAV